MQTSKYLAGCFFTDTSGLFAKQFETVAPVEAATSTLQSVVSGAGTGDRKQTQWLMLARPQGVMEVSLRRRW
jgi:cleavage and polyadenylation specificity factor subunit 1